MSKEQVNYVLLKLLNKIPLFFGLNDKSKLAITSICKQEVFSEGTVIFRLGDESTKMYLIIGGQIDILLSNDQLVATIQPGRLFGEMGILTSEYRSASAVARTKVHTFSISKQDLDSLMLRNPIVGKELLKNVAKLLSEKISANNLLIETQNKKIKLLEHRLAKCKLDLEEITNKKQND